MKNKIAICLVSLMTLLLTSCFETTVTPPSWKGFNYVVKRPLNDGSDGVYEQIERGEPRPGDEIKVYAVRKNVGKNVGMLSGIVRLRYSAITEEGLSVGETMEQTIISEPNSTADGWEDPYAIFTLPKMDRPYTSYKLEVACHFYFKTFGNEHSEIDYGDNTSHEAPYLGHIYTDLEKLHPMNGGEASSGKVGSEWKFHTIYQ
jgi:hypothetical protein